MKLCILNLQMLKHQHFSASSRYEIDKVYVLYQVRNQTFLNSRLLPHISCMPSSDSQNTQDERHSQETRDPASERYHAQDIFLAQGGKPAQSSLCQPKLAAFMFITSWLYDFELKLDHGIARTITKLTLPRPHSKPNTSTTRRKCRVLPIPPARFPFRLDSRPEFNGGREWE